MIGRSLGSQPAGPLLFRSSYGNLGDSSTPTRPVALRISPSDQSIALLSTHLTPTPAPGRRCWFDVQRASSDFSRSDRSPRRLPQDSSSLAFSLTHLQLLPVQAPSLFQLMR